MAPAATRASLAVVIVAVGFVACPAAAAVAMSATLTVSSIVDAPPGTCQLSPIVAPGGAGQSPSSSVAVACTGSDPYSVALDSVGDAAVAPAARAGALAARPGSGVAKTFSLAGAAAPSGPTTRPPLQAIVAIVRY